MLDRGLVQRLQPLGLTQTLIDKMSVKRFQIRETHQLRGISLVPDVALLLRFSSRHCFAVLPNSAMFSRSASLA